MFKIGEVASQIGTSVRSLRHLDAMGVLSPEHRDANGYRYYSKRDVERLTYINLLQLVGFTLREIPDLLKLDDTREEFAIHAQMLKNKGRYLTLLGELVEESTNVISERDAQGTLETLHQRLGEMSAAFHGEAVLPDDESPPPEHDQHREIITLLRTFIVLREPAVSSYKRLVKLVPMLENEAYLASFMTMIRVYKSSAFKLDELDIIEKNFLKTKKALESDIV
ncbi:MAG: MerR family transcriptional regulator [Deltaproteobacteria bacterium]|nr:MerR family transcriptional regulator [Deltaproteobacteria bacterium]MBN2674712.1 MerR family transcriptional regulator [Deltaproteobacteria bacterium]